MSFAVVILSKNIDNLRPCVAAVRENEPGAEIIWVDDRHLSFYRSTEDDGAAEVYRAARLPHITTIEGKTPFVFARNANLGICAAMGMPLDNHPGAVGAPFDGVVLLNDDALLTTPGGFSLLERECQLHPEFGIIASTCNNVGNPAQRPRGAGLREEKRTVCFVCVYIPRRTIDAVGLVDERFVKYGLDDDDYSLRVRNSGLKLGIHDGCYVDHGSLKSSYRDGPQAAGDFRHNLRIFIEKWGVDNWGNARARSQFPECFPLAVTQ